jgi:hypothetical protein
MLAKSSEKIALGNLVAAAFDRAAHFASDPDIAAELVAFTVATWLRRTGQLHLLRLLDEGERQLFPALNGGLPEAKAA